MTKHPQVQERLFQEMCHFIEKGDFPSWDHVNMHMTYLGNVIKEVLRLVPPAPITNRVATQDDELCGNFIPKGTTVFIVPGLLHRIPEIVSGCSLYE